MTDTLAKLEPVDVPKPEAEDQQFYSVTTIIGVLDKPALLYWSAEMAAKAAVKVAGSLSARIEEDGEEAVVKWLRDAMFRRPKGERTAAELGTAVHAACEEYALTGVKPVVDDEVRPFLDQFDAWAHQAQPKYSAVETTVYSPKWGFAGTLDAIIEIDGQVLLTDYKTTKKSLDGKGKETKPYGQVGYQLAAYRFAELAAVWRPRRFERFQRRYYLLGPDEKEMAVPMPKVDGGMAIHITPEHCRAYPIRCDEPVFDAFLYILEAFRAESELSKAIVGKPLVFEKDPKFINRGAS
jgi:hypothetical protein